MAPKIALGATGLASASGLVAVGVATANKPMREKMGRNFKKGVSMIQHTVGEFEEQANPRAVAHKLNPKKSSSTHGKKRRSVKK